jgi:hypothetical protein
MPCPPLVEVGDERVRVTLGLETLETLNTPTSTLETMIEEHREEYLDGTNWTDGDQADLERPCSSDGSSLGGDGGSGSSAVAEVDLVGAVTYSDSEDTAAA